MEEKKFEDIYYFSTYHGKRKEAQKFIEKLKVYGVKVFETKLDSVIHEEFYYYKDLYGNHHIIVIYNNIPEIELIIHENITADELANGLKNALLSSDRTSVVNAILKIPELELIASEIILRGAI